MSANNNTYKNYSAKEIMTYIKGTMPAEEMYALEKQALEDPILADSIEGYALIAEAEANQNIEKIQEQITTPAKVVSINNNKKLWLRIAAAAVAIFGIFGLANIYFKKENIQVAQNKATNENNIITTTDSNSSKPTAPQENETADTKKPVTKEPQTIEAATNYVFVKPEDIKTVYSSGKFEASVPDMEFIADSLSLTNSEIAKAQPSAPSVNKPSAPSTQNENKETDISQVFQSAPTEEAINPGRAVVTNNSNYNSNVGNVFKKEAIPVNKAIQLDDKSNIGKANFNNYLFNYKLVDNNGNALPFANITIPTDQISTYSRADGRFGLFSADSTLPITIKSQGYITQSFKLNPTTDYRSLVLQKDESAYVDAETVVVTRANSAKAKQTNAAPIVATKIELAEPLDGIDYYNTYVSNNANEAIPKGEVVLSFEVNNAGEATKIKVENAASPLAAQEAVRLLSQGPKFKPTKKRKSKKAKMVIKL